MTTSPFSDTSGESQRSATKSEVQAPSKRRPRGALALYMETRLHSDEQIEALAEIIMEAYRVWKQTE